MFNTLSIDLTKKIDKNTKKNNGIYFTPNSIIEKMYKYLLSHLANMNCSIYTICEPSCGSCQFINYLDKTMDNNIHIDGYELNNTIYDGIKELIFTNKVSIINKNYLLTGITTKYNLIIGNPPFYVMKKGDIPKDIENNYKKYYSGRANIFVLFIIHSIFKLEMDGILSFVLPKNFLNCLYYNSLREYINMNMSIIGIYDCSGDDYLETDQDTIIFIIQNKKGNNIKYSKVINNNTIFNTEEGIIQINEYYKNSKSLDEMGFHVKVGSVTWNEHKDILTDDNNYTRLIYSGDIKNNKFVPQKYKDSLKKNFIKREGNSGPCLVVNRGYGKGKYKFSYCIIDMDSDYLIENHLICIIPKIDKKMEKDELLDIYNRIVESFNNPLTEKFIGLYFANNAINCKELEIILPIYK